MTHILDNTHVFVLRVWLEHRDVEGVSEFWRGMIQSVNTGETRYFQNLQELQTILDQYIGHMGGQNP